MDPITAVSLAASIVQLIDATTKVIKYLNDVKDAPKDRARLARETTSLLALLTDLRYKVEEANPTDPWFNGVFSLGVEGGPLEQFDETIKELVKKLKPGTGIKKFNKILLWTLDKNEISETLTKIERLKTLVGLALQNDQLKLSRAIEGDIAEVKNNTRETARGVAELRVGQEDDQREKIHRWLSAPDPSLNHNEAREKRQAQTGAWFIGSKQYTNWKTNPNSFIWLHGIPGCGKTILSSTVVEDVLHHCDHDSSLAVAYFYFDFNDIEKQQHEKMIRSLITQLSMQCASTPKVLESLFSSKMNGNQQPMASELLMALRQMIQNCSETFIIVDALDECKERQDLLTDIEEIAEWKTGKLHILATSRRERDIEEGIEHLVNDGDKICIQSTLVSEDISTYVRERLQTDRRLKRWQNKPEAKQEIEETLTKKAEGVFRWAVCQLDALVNCLNLPILRKALASLPKTLDDTYARILEQIEEEHSQNALKVLEWLAYSARPLQLKEVAEVITVDIEGNPRVGPERRCPEPLDILICSSLVTLTTNGEVRLAHFSVKEYLASKRIQDGPDSIPSSCGTTGLFQTNAEELLSADNRQSPTPLDQNRFIFHEKPSTRLARKILGLIQTYGQNVVTRDNTWLSKAKFTPVIESQIESREAVRLILPAFPSKSANKLDKVLGPLPDMGEELALAHLNGLCRNIADIYEPGATVTILSDGLVYNDLDFTPDEEVWNYTEALRQIVLAKGFSTNIRFIRVMDLLGLHSSRAITRDEYLALISECRKELMAQFGDPNFDFRLEISRNRDTCMTYSGYKRFLQKDLLYTDYARNASSKTAYRKICKKVAADMITRGKAFAKLIEVKCPDYVRLSIHPSTNETKLSIPLVPQELGKFSMTPWHCAVAVDVNGSFKTAHVSDLHETHDVIYSGSRPFYFRERSALYDLGASVELEHLYPCGLIVRPAQSAGPISILDINMRTLRKLGERQSPIILRGFSKITERGVFVEAASKIGEVLSWSPGKVERIFNHKMDHTSKDINNSGFTIPTHFNSIVGSTVNGFQCTNHAGDERHSNLKSYKWPRFELFTCVNTSTQGCGDTLFVSSRRLFQFLSYLYPVESLERATWKLQNDDLGVHNGLKDLPLVVQYLVQHMPYSCWHQPWPVTRISSQDKITAEGGNEDITKAINDLLYDRRVCLRFSWENGDVLLLGNTAISHAGAPYLGEEDREIWRVRLN
ncbi:hypothetical protein FGG08_003815 [Glutinoglossum americanum]|uniref:NACHT domain-containing protein n=1 Tax=Glutinoglossum americanum TaxID=1670608 RepID=A0A9P8I3J9_9PEZI|nr:hypothetical protein FGG08_003815 [Glutinoglossum americanum]